MELKKERRQIALEKEKAREQPRASSPRQTIGVKVLTEAPEGPSVRTFGEHPVNDK
jgi:hypothetical protein